MSIRHTNKTSRRRGRNHSHDVKIGPTGRRRKNRGQKIDNVLKVGPGHARFGYRISH